MSNPKAVSLDLLDAIPPQLIAPAIARLAARAMGTSPAAGEVSAPAGDDLLTVEETAKLLKLTPRGVYRRANALGAIRMGRSLRFSRRRLLARLASSRSRG